MKEIGLFYGTETEKTAVVAKKIQQAMADVRIEVIPVENAQPSDFEKYDNIIVGASTWFDGELPNYWDEVLPEIESINMKGKRVAIFGLGDQLNYPDNFVDSIGILADAFGNQGAAIVGFTSIDGYKFNHSKAEKNNQFKGLAIDIENQNDMTDARIRQWVSQLEKEFEEAKFTMEA